MRIAIRHSPEVEVRPEGAAEGVPTKVVTVAAVVTGVGVLDLAPRPPSCVTAAGGKATSLRSAASRPTLISEPPPWETSGAADRREVVEVGELGEGEAAEAAVFVPWEPKRIITRNRPGKGSLKTGEIKASGRELGSLTIDARGTVLRLSRGLVLSTSQMSISPTLTQSRERNPILRH